MRLGTLCIAALFALATRGAHAQEPPPQKSTARGSTADRVVVRWWSQTTGGAAKPQVITARELGFQARIEAMAEGENADPPYADKHVRAAIQRHVTESMLALLPVKPKPLPQQVARYAEAARLLIEQQVGGRERLNGAATAEGLSAEELNAMLRRRARASWYLDKMVAPMLRPSELDLREVHRSGETPFSNQRFEDVEAPLTRWYVADRLANALDQFYRNVRARVRLVVIDR